MNRFHKAVWAATDFMLQTTRGAVIMLIISVLTTVGLVACTACTDEESKQVKYKGAGVLTYERCIDGTVYLITHKGGITPKLKSGEGSTPLIFSCVDDRPR